YATAKAAVAAVVSVLIGRIESNVGHVLTFRELETFPRAGLPGFFSLSHPRITAEQALGFQCAPQIGIHLEESARNSKLHRAGLPHTATAAGVDRQIISIYRLGSLKW